MKNAVFLIGFVGAGLVGAVGGRFLFPPEMEGDGLEAPALTESRIEELETRMDRLAEELRVVRADQLAPAPLAETAFPEVEGPEAVDVPAREEPVANAGSDAIDEEKVVEIIEAREREQRERRAKWAEAAQVKKEAAWLGRLKEPLGLTDRQIKDLLRLLAGRRVAVAGFNRRSAAGAGDESEQAAIKAERADYGRRLDGELRSLLSATQYEGLMRSARGGGK